MINETEDIDTLLSHKDKLNTSFESEKSTSLDYNKSHIKQSQEEFDTSIKRDKIKDDYCVKNNIKLIRIPYWEINNIETILINKLNLK